MVRVRSYLEGRWMDGDGDGQPLFDASSGAEVARASTVGLDLGAALAYARVEGGSRLRAMTFGERAALVKRLGEIVHANRDELCDLARVNSGNTRSDAKFDVDGGSSTMAAYARWGAAHGDQRVMVDGDVTPILRSKRFVGVHLVVPRTGVAVHINAFNFPAWGMCEKLAVTLLAGMPALVKPATATALVAERIVALWEAAGALPPGVVSLLSASAGDLLDHLGPQDAVAFTGSGDTGRLIKGHPAVLKWNVPVNVEADSLNGAVLGPDVEPDSDTWQMFVSDVARDITQKAGQKCTAIRRVLVPSSRVAEVVEALSDRLANAPMGDPSERATIVGPLATASQRRDVTAGLERLIASGCTVAFAGGEVPASGYWVAPRLLVAPEGGTDAVHEHEVFGPVATIVPWSGDASEAAAIIARGGGGLVTSMYSDDASWSGTLLLGLLPWHGRVVWGSRKVHDQGAGPGTVLPDFVHGGPGKAGGGEELGGLRGLRFYSQRTAVQADGALLARALGLPLQ